MITLKLQIILIAVMVCYFCILFHFLITSQLLLKYTLVWIFMGVIMLIFVLWPNALKAVSSLLGVYSDVNFLFLLMIGLTLCLVMSLTIIVSRMSSRNKDLIQTVALLEERLRKLEKESSKENNEK